MNKLSIAGCVAATCALLACGIYLWFLPPPQTGQTVAAKADSSETVPARVAAITPAGTQDAPLPGATNRRGGNQGNAPGGRGGWGGNMAADGAPGGGIPRDRGMFPGRDATGETIALIALASLNPDFDLTKEQKEKIQAIAEEAKAAGKWRADHDAELRKLDEDMRNARQDGQREELELLTQKQQDLMATGPKAEDLTAKLKAVLTPEQLKALDAAAAEKRAADDQRRRQGGGMFGGGRGGRGGGMGGAPGGAPGQP